MSEYNRSEHTTENFMASIDQALSGQTKPDTATLAREMMSGFDKILVMMDAEDLRLPWLRFGDQWFEQRWQLVRQDPIYQRLLVDPNQEPKEIEQQRMRRARQLLDSDDPEKLIKEARKNP